MIHYAFPLKVVLRDIALAVGIVTLTTAVLCGALFAWITW